MGAIRSLAAMDWRPTVQQPFNGMVLSTSPDVNEPDEDWAAHAVPPAPDPERGLTPEEFEEDQIWLYWLIDHGAWPLIPDAELGLD
jgi:hypothetical protein